MKPHYALIIAFCLIGMQQFFQNVTIFATVELSLAIQYLCLTASFFLILFFATRGLSMSSDSLITMILFILGFWVAGFATVASAFVVVNFFDWSPFKIIDPKIPMLASLIGQLLLIGGFALNGIAEEWYWESKKQNTQHQV